MSRSGRAVGVAGAAGLIAIVTLVARLAGFGRTLVFADSVRAAGIGEVYNAVNAVPNVLYEVAAGGALAAVAVPLVAGHLGRGAPERAHQVGSALLTWAVAILVPIGLVVALVAEPLAAALVGSKITGGVDAGATMLRIFAVQIPLYGIGVVLAGILQAHRRFLWPALAPLLSSVLVIATYAGYGSLVHGATTGVGPGPLRLLAWGTTAGVAALSLPLFVPAWRTGWRWRPTWRFPDGEVSRARALAGAGVLALAAQQAALLVTIWVANHRGGGAGTLSVYAWVQAVYLLPYAVLAVPIATAAFPNLAARTTASDPAAEATLARSLRAVVVLAGLGATVLVTTAPQVGRFFALLDARRGGGSASGGAVGALGMTLQAYAPGLIGLAAGAVLVRALYVRGRPGTAAAAVAAGWGVAAIGPLVFVPAGSAPDRALLVLGLASSVGMTVSAVLLGVLVRRSWGRAALAGVRQSAVAATVAFVLATILSQNLLAERLPLGGLAASIVLGLVAGLVGTLLYAVLIWFGDRSSVALIDPRRMRGGGAS